MYTKWSFASFLWFLLYTSIKCVSQVLSIVVSCSIPLLDDFVPGSYSLSLSGFVVSKSLISYNNSFVGGSLAPSHRRRSYAIFDAIFLKPILVPIRKYVLHWLGSRDWDVWNVDFLFGFHWYLPEILLNRTPFKDNRGNLHTSISHWTNESLFGSPCTQSRTNLKKFHRTFWFQSDRTITFYFIY